MVVFTACGQAAGDGSWPQLMVLMNTAACPRLRQSTFIE
jgi:hypothetical protein